MMHPRLTLRAGVLLGSALLLATERLKVIAAVHPGLWQPAVLGSTPAEKAEIASWNWRIEFEGLMAIADGFALLDLDDQTQLALELSVYDALYAWAQEQVGRTDQAST